MTTNPSNCTKCNRASYQVKLVGDLTNVKANDIYTKFHNDVVDLLHVAKKVEQPVCYAHFESQEDAAAFFHENNEHGYSNGDLFCLVKPPNQNITYGATQISDLKRKLLESEEISDKKIKGKQATINDFQKEIEKLNKEIDMLQNQKLQIKKVVDSIA